MLRQEMRAKRQEIPPVEKRSYDRWINEKLAEIIDRRNCRLVHAYIPLRGEINIRPLLEKLLKENKTVICPKTLPRPYLENRILKSFDELETGVMKTRFPAQCEVYDGPIDLIIVPGLAIDARKYRLGYGGGYYDHFLAQHPEAYKLGIYYPFQLIDRVPVEPHDVPLDDLLVRGYFEPEKVR